MWSFAIILWELYTREVPFGKYSAVQCGLLVREHFFDLTDNHNFY